MRYLLCCALVLFGCSTYKATHRLRMASGHEEAVAVACVPDRESNDKRDLECVDLHVFMQQTIKRFLDSLSGQKNEN